MTETTTHVSRTPTDLLEAIESMGYSVTLNSTSASAFRLNKEGADSIVRMGSSASDALRKLAEAIGIDASV